MTSDKRHAEPAPGAAHLHRVVDAHTQQVVDKVAEKLTAKADRVGRKLSSKADKLDRMAAKAAMKAEVLERIGSELSALDVWTRMEPNGRRPRFTREEIATKAMRIADTEGFEALSMRRLAAELGAGTMTLYHYVRTKDELLSLVVDTMMAEIVLGPDEPMPAGWRDAMTLLAHRSRAALQRHPWILEITDDPDVGPNGVRHFDQSLEAVASLPISLADRLDIISAVDEYVFGCCLWERADAPRSATADQEMIAYVDGLIATGEYPQLSALADEHGIEDAWRQIERHQRDPDRFDRNLRRLLDGIEADLPGS